MCKTCPVPMRFVIALFSVSSLLCFPGCKKETDAPTAQIVYIYVDSTQLPANAIADVEGNIYSTVTIGDQRWMAENLRTAHYSNGEPIPYDPVDWTTAQTGLWTTYNDDANYNTHYGKLYNWYTVSDPRNVCPAGWHVPSDVEWQELELSLGMPATEVQLSGSRGGAANVGGKMKSVVLWDAPNTGANDSIGFHALPGGFRSTIPDFSSMGTVGIWWSSTGLDPSSAWRRTLYSSNAYVNRQSMPKWMGTSIRCVEN